MGIFDRLFGGRHVESAQSGAPGEPFPWDAHPSIYEHIQAHLDPTQKGLTEGGENLPDEERVADQSQIRWAAGALDGVFSHHVANPEDPSEAHELLALVQSYSTAPTVTNKAKLYHFLTENGALGFIDPFIDLLMQQEDINQQRVYELAYSFSTEAPDRNPVKFGIAILGLYQRDNRELFHTLGRHEEFTLYSVVALQNSSDNPEPEIWKLAQQVHGWGRIHTVEQLANTADPQIKDWLLREGYKNSIMYEYLVYTCATAGDLCSALVCEDADAELLQSASEIIEALLNDGPTAGMESYEDGAAVVESFLYHMTTRAATLQQLRTVAMIRDHLQDDAADWQARAENGWTLDKQAPLVLCCSQIIDQPRWPSQVQSALMSSDDLLFQDGDRAAEILGIDTWEFHWQRLQAAPHESAHWYGVMEGCNAERLPIVLQFAEESLNLAQIATGPAMEMGLGREYAERACLEFLVQGLERFPGEGGRFVETALKSPVIRHRNLALRVLSSWDQEAWPTGIRPALQQAVEIEPDEDVRQRMEKTLRDEPIE